MTEQHHPTDEACFFCASDSEIAGRGVDPRTIYMQRPASFCPHWEGAEPSEVPA